jgi:hypothetical protein
MFHQLNDTAKFIYVALNERSTNAMAHIPSCFVGAETHRPHDLEGALMFFLLTSIMWVTRYQPRSGLLVFSKTVPTRCEKR